MAVAHRVEVVFAEDGKLSLDRLPFRAGALVEVTITPAGTDEDDCRAGAVGRHGSPLRPPHRTRRPGRLGRGEMMILDTHV